MKSIKVIFKFCGKDFTNIYHNEVTKQTILNSVVYHKVMLVGKYWLVHLEFNSCKMAFQKILAESASEAIAAVERTLSILKVENVDEPSRFEKTMEELWGNKPPKDNIVDALKEMLGIK